MLVAFDFGITNTDIAIDNEGSTQYLSIPTPKENLTKGLIKNIISQNKISLSEISVIGVTGGKSSDLENNIDSIKLIKVNEIDAIGLGARKLYQLADESALIVSAGTGTACVHVEGKSYNHLGGIAVGGGMLEGLGHLLFKNSNGLEINDFGKKGQRDKLDLLIGDVVNKIGNLSPEITAVNFGQAQSSFADTMENTAAALCNMIGEVIGTMAYLNAILVGSKNVYFTGRTSYLSLVVQGIEERLELAGIKGQYSDKREFGNVIGVIEVLKKSQ
ncbi:putative pantothenate kinase [SAR86 cluster bacterium SAR86E]|uniref:Putative pantothenate kinase n=1 Tax=SAR86 cluster bacterium SAR86E TaxID=1208365 RepID=K6GIA8_9GAMM|nr:putative pantothenate kinase [SAR86 cluster bacterium SAR86E]